MSVESNLASFWCCFTELCDWFILKTCATYSTIQPITCKTTKTNCALAARVFPRVKLFRVPIGSLCSLHLRL